MKMMPLVLAFSLIAGLTGCNLFFPDTLPGVGSIEGYAFFSNSSTHDGIIITLERSDGLYTESIVKSIERGAVSRNANFTTKTNADGFYQFRGLQPGSYTVYATSKDSLERAAVLQNIQVEADQLTLADILNLTAVGSIAGSIRVIDGSGLDHAGFLVFIAGTSYMAMTDLEGNFTIRGIPAGEGYVVIVSKKGYLAVLQTADVAAFETNDCDQKELTLQELNVPLGSIIWKGTLTSHPVDPEVNWAYYNSAAGKSYIYDGSQWQILAQDGQDGQDAVSIVWLGEFNSAPSNASLNNAYFNISDGNSYIYNGNGWDLLARAGTDGAAGVHGISIIWKGTHTSHPVDPEVNWAYYNSAAGKSYIYDGSQWQILAQDGAVVVSSIHVTGDAVVGAVLSASQMNPPDAEVTYQWKYSTNAVSFQSIGGETSESYTVQSGDLGAYIRLDISGTGDFTGTAASNVTGPVGFAGGIGTVADPYQISDWHHLNNVRSVSTLHFELVGDLDEETDGYAEHVGDRTGGWEPYPSSFSRSFDGRGYTISGLIIDRTDNYVALFRSISPTGIVRNLTLADVQVSGNDYIGSLAGSSSGSIINCHISGSVSGSGLNQYDGKYVGGITGHNTSLGTIKASTSNAFVSGTYYQIGGIAGHNDGLIEDSIHYGSVLSEDSYVGGIVGNNNSGTIISSINKGAVSGELNRVGGIAGSNTSVIIGSGNEGTVTGDGQAVGGIAGFSNAVLRDCYNTGTVKGDSLNVGGIVGHNFTPINQDGEIAVMGKVYTSYNSGTVSSTNSRVGGIAGYNQGIVEDSYNTGSVTGHWYVGGVAGLLSQTSEVTRSYNTGTVSGANMSGKIAGTSSGTLTANYYLSDTADLGSGAEQDQPGEFEAKTDDEMKLKASFINWDFADVWSIDETTSYPVLRSTLP